MKKLLISGLGGSLFPYLDEQIRDDYEIHYIDNNENLSYIYPDVNFHHVPLVNSDEYYSAIRKIVDSHKIDVYIPLIDEEIIPAIDNFGSELMVIAPRKEFVELCLNKFNLMRALDKSNISQITSYTADKYNFELDFPIFLKPLNGRGSRGIAKILNKKMYHAYFDMYPQFKIEDILVQPNIEGQEYTVGALTNNLNELVAVNSRKVISKKGITQMAVIEKDDSVTELVKQVVSELNPSGPFNIQLFKTADGDLKIFEINPRFSTTSILSYAIGVDEIKLFIENYNKSFMGQPNIECWAGP
jgi:carbamoyl-phosphate synthase large subunit